MNDRRAAVGLPPVAPDPPETEPTTETLAEYEGWSRDYEDWLKRAGWR